MFLSCTVSVAQEEKFADISYECWSSEGLKNFESNISICVGCMNGYVKEIYELYTKNLDIIDDTKLKLHADYLQKINDGKSIMINCADVTLNLDDAISEDIEAFKTYIDNQYQ